MNNYFGYNNKRTMQNMIIVAKYTIRVSNRNISQLILHAAFLLKAEAMFVCQQVIFCYNFPTRHPNMDTFSLQWLSNGRILRDTEINVMLRAVYTHSKSKTRKLVFLI